jgi:hypothetical protein
MSLELIVLARPDRPYRVTIQESIFELEPEMRLQIFCDLDAKPNIYQLLTQRRHRYRSQSSSLPDHIDDDPMTFSQLQLIQSQVHGFRAPQTGPE